MCETDYNPDTDITLYRAEELLAMLRRIKEINGELPRSSLLLNYPPFEESEIKEQLESLSIGRYTDGSHKKSFYEIRECLSENFSPMIKPMWESFSKNNVQVKIIFSITMEFVWINIGKNWIIK